MHSPLILNPEYVDSIYVVILMHYFLSYPPMSYPAAVIQEFTVFLKTWDNKSLQGKFENMQAYNETVQLLFETLHIYT